METQFIPEQEAQLAKMAAKAGTNPERSVQDVLVRYLNDEAQFLAGVEEGIASAERGEFIEEADRDARIERIRRKARGMAPCLSRGFPVS